MQLYDKEHTELLVGLYTKVRDNRIYQRLLRKRSTMTVMQLYWSKLRVYSRVIGKFIVLYNEIKVYGLSRQTTRTIEKKEEKITWDKKWVLHPKCFFKKCWDSVIIVLLFYTATILPYRLCFNTLQTMDWEVLDLTVNILYLIDICLNFNTAVSSVSERLDFSRKAIAKKYIKGWFLVDLLSSFPVDFIFGLGNYNNFFRIFRVSRIYKILKIVRLLRLLRFMRLNYIESISMTSTIQSTLVKSIGFAVVLIVIIHITACFWYFLSQIDADSDNSWVIRYDINYLDDYEVYVISIYFIFTTFTTIGYGDIVPFTIMEKCFTMLLMGFGITFYSYMIGSLRASLLHSSMINLLYKEKINGFKDFSKAIDLPFSIIERVQRCTKMNLFKSHTENADIENLITGLPRHIREQILAHVNNDIINSIDFLKNKPNNFVNDTIKLFRIYTYVYSEILYEENELPEEVYFIKSGRILLKKQETVIFRSYGQGSYFGEIEIFEETYRNSTAFVSSSSADIFTLTKANFLEVLNSYPDILEKTVNIARVRKTKNEQSLFDALIELYQDSDSFNTDSLDNTPSLEPVSCLQSAGLVRNDTAIMISRQYDNPFKKKNRELWQNVIGGQRLRRGRTYRPSALITSTKEDAKKIIKKMKTLSSGSVFSPDPQKIEQKQIAEPAKLNKEAFKRPVITTKNNVLNVGKDKEIIELTLNTPQLSPDIECLKKIKVPSESTLFGIKNLLFRLESKFESKLGAFARLSDNNKKISKLLVRLQDDFNI